MNGTNTLLGPGFGDAALLRVKGTGRAIALALDGPGRIGALDPRQAGMAAVLEGAANVACSGARPIGITNCLNFASPEEPAGYWQLVEAISGMADACRALGIPIASGNVSLYNQTPAGGILPTPVVGTVGLLEDRSRAVPMAWRAGDELWLLGDPAFDEDALAASELAWRRGRFGGRPWLDLPAAVRLLQLMPELAERDLVTGAHDLAIGGLGVGLARMAIAAGSGASVQLPGEAVRQPTAALFGERVGRVIVSAHHDAGAQLAAEASAAGVPARQLGTAGGEALVVRVGDAELRLAVDRLAATWETALS
jgi:phosphoribosylformylglycinamidine synthase